MRITGMLALLTSGIGALLDAYERWANSPIKLKGVLVWLYVFGTSIYFAMKQDFLGWNDLPQEEVIKRISFLLFWFYLACVSMARIINGCMVNYQEAIRKMELEKRKGWRK